MNISPSFSPSIKLMKPYFLLSAIFYLLSFITLLYVDINSTFDNLFLLGWVHTYMVGFVMMAILSAMAQLGPVVTETKHFKVELFKYIWMLLLSGLVLMLIGFYINITFLSAGGFLVLSAMIVYVYEFLLTLRTASRHTSITSAMWMSNFFLIVGIVSGIVMALSFSGVLTIDANSILKTHTFGLLAGFVILLIMGISIILIPMFGSSKRISDNEFKWSFYTLTLSVIFMILSLFIYTKQLEQFSYALAILSIVLYFYQLFFMFKSRKRIEHDIWAKYIYVGATSFIISFILLCVYLFLGYEQILKIAMWLMLVGFFGSFIIGNLYKIIPFLVWFHIYSPLIETQSVPMLHELVPNRLSNLQWFYNTLGLIFTTIALVVNSKTLFIGGVTLYIVSSIILLQITYKLLESKK